MRFIAPLALLFILSVSSSVRAQWPMFPNPGPKTADGKLDLEAPPPRTPDGKPDLSGSLFADGRDAVTSHPYPKKIIQTPLEVIVIYEDTEDD